MVIDFHAHCFPDEVARRAMPKLEEAAGVKPCLDGTLGELLKSMDKAQINLSVLQHIATRPGQEQTINKWASDIQGDRIISFGTIHPDSPNWREEIQHITDCGLKGVKFHPDYQGFYVGEARMFPIYEALCNESLIVLFHSGVDIGLPDPCHCRPSQLRTVVDRFPEGRWVAAHMGGWRYWGEVEAYLLGRPVYLDTSYSYSELGAARMKALIRAHGVNRILFGTDSPWADQTAAIAEIRSLGLTSEEERAIMGENACTLLNGGLTNERPL